MDNPQTNEANRVIDALGGPSKVGASLEISKSAVSQWRKRGIPRTQKKLLRLAHPELFNQASSQVMPP